MVFAEIKFEWFFHAIDHSQVLMPLVNTPMLDYTIDFLAQNNVKEVTLHRYIEGA